MNSYLLQHTNKNDALTKYFNVLHWKQQKWLSATEQKKNRFSIIEYSLTNALVMKTKFTQIC